MALRGPRPGRRRHRLRPRLARATAGAALAGLIAAGCGSGGGGNANAAGGGGSGGVTNVVWWNMWSGATLAITKEMVNKFNATHPSIHVTQLNVPSSDGDAKLLSAVAAGDPPDVFTEWNPVLGEYAHTHAVQPLDRFLVGKYAGLKKWMYPVVLDGGLVKGHLYGVSMSMGTLGLYYNKELLKARGISQPPKTLAQLDSDQAKLWKISGGRVKQIGFYPLTTPMYELMSYWGVHAFVHGRYDLADNPRALALAKWMASYDKYPYSAVTALDTAFGSVGGGSEDPFDMGKSAFWMSGAWEGVENIPPDNPSLVGHFGVEPFPHVPGGTKGASSFVWGNYNVIPRGSKHAAAAFQFLTWLAGYRSTPTIAKILPKGGWIPASPQVAANPAYKAWLKAKPYVRPLVSELGSPASQQVDLTPAESEYETAVTTATQYLATKKMTPHQALAYIDRMANNALKKKK